jgi:hypothetical protein
VNQPTSIAELYDIADRLDPESLRWSLDGIWVDAPVEELLAAAKPTLTTIPDSISFVLRMVLGIYPQRPNACWSAQDRIYLSPDSGWTDPTEDLTHESWVHDTIDPAAHLSVGLQFSDNNLADRFDHGLSPANAERLEEIRHTYDPNGIFNSYMKPEESTTAYASTKRLK